MRRPSFTLILLLLVGILGGTPAFAADDKQSNADNTAENGASLVGRVLYDGTPPQPRLLRIPLRIGYFRDGRQVFSDELPERRRLKDRGVPDESLIVGKDGGIANVIVWLRSKDVRTGPHRDPLPPATLRAVDGRFEPHVLAFWVKAPLQWINESGHGINFHWQAHGHNRIVNDGQFVEINVKKPVGLPTRVTSNIHPWYSAYILTLAHPYFAVTGNDGRFEIKNLLLGEWEFAIWHERSGWLETDRFPSGRFAWKVQPGENALGDLLVDPSTLTGENGASRFHAEQ